MATAMATTPGFGEFGWMKWAMENGGLMVDLMGFNGDLMGYTQPGYDPQFSMVFRWPQSK